MKDNYEKLGFVSDEVIDNSYLNAGGIVDVTKQCGLKNPLPCIGKKKSECLAKKSAFEACASSVRAGVVESLGGQVVPTARQEQTLSNQSSGVNVSDQAAIQKSMEMQTMNQTMNAQAKPKSNNMLIFGIIGAVVLIGGGFLLYRRYKKSKQA